MDQNNSNQLSGLVWGLVGTVIAALVTAKLKKMYDADQLPLHQSDVQGVVNRATESASRAKRSAAQWVANKATRVAGKADAVAGQQEL